MAGLKTALIGCGKFANRHLANLVSLPDLFEMVAFCDVLEENAKQYSGKYTAGNASVFTDFHEMFERLANLDLVLICLPPFAHSDEVETAAARGTHILIEKPIALTSDRV